MYHSLTHTVIVIKVGVQLRSIRDNNRFMMNRMVSWLQITKYSAKPCWSLRHLSLPSCVIRERTLANRSSCFDPFIVNVIPLLSTAMDVHYRVTVPLNDVTKDSSIDLTSRIRFSIIY